MKPQKQIKSKPKTENILNKHSKNTIEKGISMFNSGVDWRDDGF
jgi:hypothetical protein